MGPGVRRDLGDTRSAVEPPIFHPPAVVLAVDHDRDALQLRLPAGRGAEVVDDRPGTVFLQLLVDLPNQALAFLLIGLLGLPVEHFLQLGIAVAGVVALRAAAVILVKLLVRVIDAAPGVVLPDLVVVAPPPLGTSWRCPPGRVRRRSR